MICEGEKKKKKIAWGEGDNKSHKHVDQNRFLYNLHVAAMWNKMVTQQHMAEELFFSSPLLYKSNALTQKSALQIF